MKQRGYCDDIAAVGSEVDVCQEKNILTKKVTEIKEQPDPIILLEARPLATLFKKSSLDGIFDRHDIGRFSGKFLK